MKFVQSLLFVALMVMLVTSMATSQAVNVKVHIEYPSTGDSGNIWFGYDKLAHYCMLDGDSLLGEKELPPFPFDGFEARLVNPNPPIGSDDCFGEGSNNDYRPWFIVSQTDTFLIKMLAPSGPTANFSWTWPAGLSSQFQSLRLEDNIAHFLIFDMLSVTSASTNGNFTRWLIIATPIVNAAQLDNNVIPNEFALNQNYPNPFNPSTTVSFAIEKAVFADVAIFDVLGRKVKTLASEQLAPGYYSTQWNGVDDHGFTAGSGVYFVRMSARSTESSTQSVFTAVRKLLLMK